MTLNILIKNEKYVNCENMQRQIVALIKKKSIKSFLEPAYREQARFGLINRVYVT